MLSLRVTFSDGISYDIPANIIATERAKYYAEHDTKMKCGQEFDEAFKKEYDYTMDNPDEIIDWATNNMDWKDVKERATMVILKKKKESLYDDEWCNADHKVVSS